MSRFFRFALASALFALPATVNAQVVAKPDSAHRALARAQRAEKKEQREERREQAGKTEKHPEIRAAIRSLERAKLDLQRAAHDFGGHRADALRATDEAIKQLRLALEYDKK